MPFEYHAHGHEIEHEKSLKTMEEKLFEDLEHQDFKYAGQSEMHDDYFDRKAARKESKRQRKLEKHRRTAEELAAFQHHSSEQPVKYE